MAGQQFVRWGYGGQTQHQTGPSSSTASAAPDSTFDDPSSVTVSSRRRSSNLSSSSPPVTGSDEEGSNSIVVDPLDLSSTCNNLNNNSTSSSSSGKTFITAPGRWNRTSLHSQQIATASSSNLQHSVQDQNSSDCVMATSAGNMEQPSAAVNPSAAVLSVTPLSMMGSSTAGVSGGADEAHKCDMCGKTFAVPARLTRHYRTHTGCTWPIDHSFAPLFLICVKYLKENAHSCAKYAEKVFLLRRTWAFIDVFTPRRSLTDVRTVVVASSTAESYTDICVSTLENDLISALIVGKLSFNLVNSSFTCDHIQVILNFLFISFFQFI